MKGFKKFGGEEIEDLGAYVKDYLFQHRDVLVFVGCDSEQYKRHTQYAVAVCLYHPGKGGHVIFRKERVQSESTGRNYKIRFLGERLWSEIERVKAVADYFETVLDGHIPRMSSEALVSAGYNPEQNNLVEVHVDFNPNPNTPVVISKKKRKRSSLRRMTDNKSNQLHAAAVGYLVGNGYRVKSKPDAWASSTAADLVARK